MPVFPNLKAYAPTTHYSVEAKQEIVIQEVKQELPTLKEYLVLLAKENNLNASLLSYIITLESNWNEKAINPTSKACGLAQFINATMKHVGLTKEECLNGYQNLDSFVKLFREEGVRHWCSDYRMMLKINVRFPNVCKAEWVNPVSLQWK